MTDKKSASSRKVLVDEGVGSPKKGEKYRCAKCGMAIEVLTDCGSDQPGSVHFHRCGQELRKV